MATFRAGTVRCTYTLSGRAAPSNGGGSRASIASAAVIKKFVTVHRSKLGSRIAAAKQVAWSGGSSSTASGPIPSSSSVRGTAEPGGGGGNTTFSCLKRRRSSVNAYSFGMHCGSQWP